MFELRIVGSTPHELMQRLNAVANALLIGAPDTRPAEDPFPASDNVGAEAVAGPNPSVSSPPKRGRKPKAPPVTIGVEANAPAEPLQTADFLDDAPASAEPPKAYTEADCREAVKQCLDGFEARARAADPSLATLKGAAKDEAEKKLMAAKIKWTKPLLEAFAVAKVSELKPDQYAAFMRAAQPYIDGSQGA